jgi:hypothetical protein
MAKRNINLLPTISTLASTDLFDVFQDQGSDTFKIGKVTWATILSEVEAGDSPLTTDGDIMSHNGTDNIRIPILTGTINRPLICRPEAGAGSKIVWNSNASGVEQISFGTMGSLTSTVLTEYGAVVDPVTPSGVRWTQRAGTAAHEGYALRSETFNNNNDSEMVALSEKVTPASTDLVVIEDSADSYNKKKVQIGNISSGSISPLTTDGDIYYYNTTNARLPIGTAKKILTSNGSLPVWGGDIAISSSEKFYLDGGSDTYITESSSNQAAIYAGGDWAAIFGESLSIVHGTLKTQDNLTVGPDIVNAGTGAQYAFTIANGTPSTTPPANACQIYAKDISSSSELFAVNEAGIEFQLTSAGGSASTFLDLTDSPSTYTGSTGRLVVSSGSALNFNVDSAAGNAVNYIAFSRTNPGPPAYPYTENEMWFDASTGTFKYVRDGMSPIYEIPNSTNVLTKTNTTSFTPSADYHPATKKYVDDNITSGDTILVQDEGTPLATAATTLNFVGAGVTASGTGTTKTITIPGGGTSPLTTKGDLWGFSTVDARVPVGSFDGALLKTNSANVNGVSWQTATTGAGDLLVGRSSGGFFVLPTGGALADGKVLTANSADADGMSWETPAGLPTPSGARKLLVTDSTASNWVENSDTNKIGALNLENVVVVSTADRVFYSFNDRLRWHPEPDTIEEIAYLSDIPSSPISTAWLSANKVMTSTTAFSNVTGLAFGGLSAGKQYLLEGKIIGTAATAGGLKLLWNFSGSVAYRSNAVMYNTSATAINIYTSPTSGIMNDASALNPTGYVDFSQVIEVSGSGDLQLQAAQETSNATSTIIYRGSWIRITEL